jgi:hypothetical protein
MMSLESQVVGEHDSLHLEVGKATRLGQLARFHEESRGESQIRAPSPSVGAEGLEPPTC